MIVECLVWEACTVECPLNAEHSQTVGRCSARVYGLDQTAERVEVRGDGVAWLNVVEHEPRPRTEGEVVELWAAEAFGVLRPPRDLYYARARVVLLDSRRMVLAAEVWEEAPGCVLKWPVRVELTF